MNLLPRLFADIDIETASKALKAIRKPDASHEQMDAALEFIARNLAAGIPRGFKNLLIDYVIRTAQGSTDRKLGSRFVRRQVATLSLASLNEIAAGRQNVRPTYLESITFAVTCSAKALAYFATACEMFMISTNLTFYWVWRNIIALQHNYHPLCKTSFPAIVACTKLQTLQQHCRQKVSLTH